MNDTPTRGELFSALGTADALPLTTYVSYNGEEDRARYDLALDVLAECDWLPVDDESIVDNVTHECVRVGDVTFSSPVGHKPLTDARKNAQPIEKLAAVVLRVGDVEVEITGDLADGLRAVVASATGDASGAPLPSRQPSDRSNVVRLVSRGRGRQDAPLREGA